YLGLRHLHKSCPHSLLDRASPLGVILKCIHNPAPESRLPRCGELLIQTLSPGFSYANHVGVVFRKILISRQHSTSNAARGEIHNCLPHDVLNSGYMVGLDCRSLAHDSPEGTARERLELLEGERRLVPFGCRLDHKLIAPAFEERLIDNGLTQGRLEQGHSELNAGGLFNRNGLWDGCLIGAVCSKKEQQGSEDNRTHADSHYDVDGVVTVRHNDLLSTGQSNARQAYRSTS